MTMGLEGKDHNSSCSSWRSEQSRSARAELVNRVRWCEWYLPGEVRDHQPGESVDQTEDRDTDEQHPPHPEDKEVLLVEDVVVKDAEIVAGVDTTSSSTNTDIARHLEQILVSNENLISKFLTSVGKSSHMGSWVRYFPSSLIRLGSQMYLNTSWP